MLKYLPIFLLFSCCQSKETTTVDYNQIKDPLIEANKKSMLIEQDQIEGYAKRRNWPVIKTNTGLRYFIYEQKPEAKKAESGMVAKVSYDIRLLNGDICYSTKETGPRSFLIDMDHVESGLHEAIQYMHIGEKAFIIIPSHLAYGLTGDSKKIPQNATIVYDITLIDLRKP